MENKPIWHYRSPTPEEYKVGLKDLENENKFADIIFQESKKTHVFVRV